MARTLLVVGAMQQMRSGRWWVASVVLLAGCEAPRVHPRTWMPDPDAVVFEAAQTGGYGTPEHQANQLPAGRIWADGHVIWTETDDAGRREVLGGTLEPAARAELLEVVDTVGLHGWAPVHVAEPPIADVPRRVLTVDVPGCSRTVEADWGAEPDGFLQLYGAIASGAGADGSPWQPTGGWLRARPVALATAQAVADWDPITSGVDLAGVDVDRWVEGAALQAAWDVVNEAPDVPVVVQDDQAYALRVVVPELMPR